MNATPGFRATADEMQRKRELWARGRLLESGAGAPQSKKNWLPDMDLNHDKQIQSLLCYRYTIGQ